MTTTVMSARVDANQLKFADKLAKTNYGCNFAKYCTMLLSNAFETKSLPKINQGKKVSNGEQKEILGFIKTFRQNATHPEIATLSDSELKDLIAKRYM